MVMAGNPVHHQYFFFKVLRTVYCNPISVQWTEKYFLEKEYTLTKLICRVRLRVESIAHCGHLIVLRGGSGACHVAGGFPPLCLELGRIGW